MSILILVMIPALVQTIQLDHMSDVCRANSSGTLECITGAGVAGVATVSVIPALKGEVQEHFPVGG